MAYQENSLESKAANAREDIGFTRSKYPSICANWLLRSIKSNIKTSTTFKVKISDDERPLECLSAESMERLDVKKEVGLSYKKTRELEDQFNQISRALDMIGSNK